MMGCLVQGWSATVNHCRQLTEPSVWLVSLSFSSAVNLLKSQKQDWETEYLPEYTVYWKIMCRIFLTSSFLACKLFGHSDTTVEKKNPKLHFENQMPGIKLYFLHRKPRKCITMCTAAKAKCFAKVNMQSMLKGNYCLSKYFSYKMFYSLSWFSYSVMEDWRKQGS